MKKKCIFLFLFLHFCNRNSLAGLVFFCQIWKKKSFFHFSFYIYVTDTIFQIWNEKRGFQKYHKWSKNSNRGFWKTYNRSITSMKTCQMRAYECFWKCINKDGPWWGWGNHWPSHCHTILYAIPYPPPSIYADIYVESYKNLF